VRDESRDIVGIEGVRAWKIGTMLEHDEDERNAQLLQTMGRLLLAS
jgi:hypothetical protein